MVHNIENRVTADFFTTIHTSSHSHMHARTHTRAQTNMHTTQHYRTIVHVFHENGQLWKRQVIQ